MLLFPYSGAEQVPTLTLTPSDLSHTIKYNGGDVNPKNAGDYAVVVTVNDSRYSETVNGTFTINPATITVTAANASVVYGDANPDFSVFYSGFMGSEAASDLTTKATATTTAVAKAQWEHMTLKLVGQLLTTTLSFMSMER